jgi:hypothetical protein
MAPIPKPVLPLPEVETRSGAQPVFPTGALGLRMAAAATVTAARAQAPAGLAAHHLLTLAAMAAQRLIGVRLPTGACRPVSCYFATLIGPGEGRGALLKSIVDPLRAPFAGAGPASTVHTFDLFAEPRVPGANDRYRSFRAQSALFAGHSEAVIAPSRARRSEAASLADLWDGRRVESRSVLTKAVHPRLSLHLTATPRDGADLLGDPGLADCGLLGRLLVAAPASRIGARVWAQAGHDDPPELAAFHAHVKALTQKDSTAHTRVISFTEAAAAQWFAFAQEMESGMREGGAFACIRPLGTCRASRRRRRAHGG